jgi:hypothetical protein
MKGNVNQIKWDVILEGYKGRLSLEVNLMPGVEIRISFNESFDHVCIRRLECPLNDKTKYGHRNSSACGNNDRFEGIHKHRYMDRVKDGCAYTPNDIDQKSLESIIRTFAKECNIFLVGPLPSLVTQKSLFNF